MPIYEEKKIKKHQQTNKKQPKTNNLSSMRINCFVYSRYVARRFKPLTLSLQQGSKIPKSRIFTGIIDAILHCLKHFEGVIDGK